MTVLRFLLLLSLALVACVLRIEAFKTNVAPRTVFKSATVPHCLDKKPKNVVAIPRSNLIFSSSSMSKNTWATFAAPSGSVVETSVDSSSSSAVCATGCGEASKPKPTDLFAKFGIAYLLTSITLSIISYASFYFMISRGVDVSSLLAKVGIEASSTSANAGTAAIAYAMHKAASPIRFPPTVALTPFVARLIGYKPKPKAAPEDKK
jgi:hypothetical protein